MESAQTIYQNTLGEQHPSTLHITTVLSLVRNQYEAKGGMTLNEHWSNQEQEQSQIQQQHQQGNGDTMGGDNFASQSIEA